MCGAISIYNDKTPTMVPSFIQYMIYNVRLFCSCLLPSKLYYFFAAANYKCKFFFLQQLKMEGFVVTKYANRWDEAVKELSSMIREGKLKVEETILDGLESTPQAFINLFVGKNKGKMMVKL